MPAGRPSKYKPEFCDQLIEHMKEGLGYEIFAATVGVCDDTLRHWEQAHPEFLAAKKRGRALQAIWWHKLGRAASAGKIEGFNATAFVWCTKNMLGWRDKHDVDIGGKADSPPIQISTTSDAQNLTEAELKELLKQALKEDKVSS